MICCIENGRRWFIRCRTTLVEANRTVLESMNLDLSGYVTYSRPDMRVHHPFVADSGLLISCWLAIYGE